MKGLIISGALGTITLIILDAIVLAKASPITLFGPVGVLLDAFVGGTIGALGANTLLAWIDERKSE